MSTLAVAVSGVNPEKKLIEQARRAARRHGLRMRKSRAKYFPDQDGYRLESITVIGGGDFELSPHDIIRICEQLGDAR